MTTLHLAAEAYRIMWLFVFFDLPVTTQAERKRATKFRKDLLQDGFAMMQFSVYVRHCGSKESASVHVKRIGNCVPRAGRVSILSVTDKQFGKAVHFEGREAKPSPSTPLQLEFF